MKILGAILSGGLSRRFGGDKATYPIEGKPLIEHAINALTPQCEAIVLCGRKWGKLASLEDIPVGGNGPLCGLNAALHHATASGFDGVLACPVDVYPLPANLGTLLIGPRPTVFARQHLVGWWPVDCAEALDQFLASGGRAAYKWIEQSGARRVMDPKGLININEKTDLALI
jgi:molybdenum cofactor guanylyltransferase